MIEERDLDAAVAAGVIDAAARERLVVFARNHRLGAAGPDEETFRLLTGFNDIFVSIAVGLLLFAIGTIGGLVHPALGTIAVAASAWGLAEYFTRQRRMALPSIVLLLVFVAASAATIPALFGDDNAKSALQTSIVMIGAGAVGAVAAFAHWRRFMVPITVAAGAAALTGMVVATLGIGSLATSGTVLPVVAVCGLAVFALAMWADGRDRARVTRWSDVAFWLHLLAAPMIVHPAFSLAGLMDPTPAPGAALVVVAVYAVLTIVALAIDRRALLVSALAYVIYAINSLIGSGEGFSASFAVTTLIIGLFLVLLSAGWRPIRSRVLALLPASLTGSLPRAAV